MKTDFLFTKIQEDKLNFDDNDLIELKPYGLSLNNETSRPFLLLKDVRGEHTLPVGISQIEAGVAMTQTQPNQLNSTPHTFLQKLIESLDITIERCVFIEISGHHQFVRLFMKGHPKYQSFKVRADEAMSLCLHLKVSFFATKSFIQKSKVMAADSFQVNEVMLPQMGIVNKNEFFH